MRLSTGSCTGKPGLDACRSLVSHCHSLIGKQGLSRIRVFPLSILDPKEPYAHWPPTLRPRSLWITRPQPRPVAKPGVFHTCTPPRSLAAFLRHSGRNPRRPRSQRAEIGCWNRVYPLKSAICGLNVDPKAATSPNRNLHTFTSVSKALRDRPRSGTGGRQPAPRLLRKPLGCRDTCRFSERCGTP